MQLPNPNQNKPFDRVSGDYGYRNEGTPDAEIVHIPTGKSNQTYYQPETVLDTKGCKHVFKIADIGKREIACKKCGWETTFHAGVMEVKKGKEYVILQEKPYLLIS